MAIYGKDITWKNTTGKYMVARSSKIKATDTGHIYDVVDTANDMEQGMNVKVGDHVTDELQLRTASTPAIGDAIAFVCDVPLIYESYTTADQSEYKYINKKGKATRAYEIVKDDVIGFSDYGFTTKVAADGQVVVGNYVVVDGARKYKELVSTTASTTLDTYGFLGKIIGFEKYQYDTIVLVEVIRNETV